MQLNVAAIQTNPGADRTESLSQVKEAIRILVQQCAALADGKLNAPIFAQQAACSGAFGAAFGTIRKNLRDSMVSIAQNSAALAASAEQLTAVSHQMAGNAEETATQARVVSEVSDDVSRRVSVVATSAEQMHASIQEIAKSATASAKVAQNAVTAAESANTTVQRLGQSSARYRQGGEGDQLDCPAKPTCWL